MATKKRKPAGSSRPTRRWLLPASAVAIVAVVLAFLLLRGQTDGKPVAWTRFNTQDVHSLAFVEGDPQRVLFGHHGGLLESRNGGRDWSSLPVRNDAMSTSSASDGSIVIAGHLVFEASRDGGQTWTPIRSDLPDLDIHGFTRDPGDPARMWAYLASGGLWESRDFGAHFTQVRADNVIHPLAVRDGSATILLGVDASGVVRSADGGRSWTRLATPPFTPVTALGATSDGRVVYGGSPDGLFRSTDGGGTWTPTAYTESVFAVATISDGQTVAVVSERTEFFRSSDGGATWPGPT